MAAKYGWNRHQAWGQRFSSRSRRHSHVNLSSLLNSRIVQCGSCGSDVSVNDAPEAQDIEPPDFDTRPGETMRSTLPYWVHRCRACGYCAGDISSMHESAGDLIGSAEYHRI